MPPFELQKCAVLFVLEEDGWLAIVHQLGTGTRLAMLWICDNSGQPNTLAFMDPELGDAGRKMWEALQQKPIFIAWKHQIDTSQVQRLDAN